jgi:hypothetical protein
LARRKICTETPMRTVAGSSRGQQEGVSTLRGRWDSRSSHNRPSTWWTGASRSPSSPPRRNFSKVHGSPDNSSISHASVLTARRDASRASASWIGRSGFFSLPKACLQKRYLPQDVSPARERHCMPQSTMRFDPLPATHRNKPRPVQQTSSARALIRRLAIALARQAAAEDDAAKCQRAKVDACSSLRSIQ